MDDLYLGELDLDPHLEKQTDSYYSKILAQIDNEKSKEPISKGKGEETLFWDFKKDLISTKNSTKTKLKSLKLKKKLKKRNIKAKPENKTIAPTPVPLDETQQLIEQALTLLLNHSLYSNETIPDEVFSQAKDYLMKMRNNYSNSSSNVSSSNSTNSKNNISLSNIFDMSTNKSSNRISDMNARINSTINSSFETNSSKYRNTSNSSLSNSSLDAEKKKESVFGKVEKAENKSNSSSKSDDDTPSLFELISKEADEVTTKPVPEPQPTFNPKILPKFTQVSDFYDDIAKANAERNPIIDESKFMLGGGVMPMEDTNTDKLGSNLDSNRPKNTSNGEDSTTAANKTKEETKMLSGLDKVSSLLEHYLNDADSDSEVIQSISSSFTNPPNIPKQNNFELPNVPESHFPSPPQLNGYKTSAYTPIIRYNTQQQQQIQNPNQKVSNNEIKDESKEKKFLSFSKESETPMIPHFFSFSK